MEPTWGALISTTAISIATVLGTGILALPVTLHRAGLPPFLLSFTFTLFAQLGVVIAMTELLQRAYAMAPKGQPVRHDEYTAIIDGAFSLRDEDEYELEDDFDSPVVVQGEAPSLHTISKLFLSHRILQFLFEGFVLLHFVSIMVSYALGAPQVYRQLVPAFAKLGEPISTALFTAVASLLIVLLAPLLYPLLTLATFAKGVLLSVLIAIALAVGIRVGLHPSAEWGLAAVESFLVGCLALSGVVNLMPVTFGACVRSCGAEREPAVSRRFVVLYRRATALGVIICYVLNVGWCIACLLIVPQSALAAANKAGENSTYPLIETLKKRGGESNANIAFLVNLFTAVSVTVSFFVMGIGMKHTLDSQLKGFLTECNEGMRRFSVTTLYYIFWFGSILCIAHFNPHAFIKVLAGVTSFSLNVEAGIFIIFMLIQSRRPHWNHAILDTSLSSATVSILTVAVGGYFTSAILIDVVLYLLRR